MESLKSIPQGDWSRDIYIWIQNIQTVIFQILIVDNRLINVEPLNLYSIHPIHYSLSALQHTHSRS